NQSVIAPLECARARIQPSAPQHEVSRVYSFTNVRCWSSCFSMSAAPNSLKAELQQIRGPNQKTLGPDYEGEHFVLTNAEILLKWPPANDTRADNSVESLAGCSWAGERRRSRLLCGG